MTLAGPLSVAKLTDKSLIFRIRCPFGKAQILPIHSITTSSAVVSSVAELKTTQWAISAERRVGINNDLYKDDLWKVK